MFKRVEKRRRKKQEEEDLGLDEEMKDVLGFNDTDSDESSSDSDGSSDEDVNAIDNDFGDEGTDDIINEEDVSEEGEDEDEIDAMSDEDDSQEDNPDVTVGEALKDPIYLVSLDPDVRACILCPGKLLKGERMIDLHRNSNAHKRRIALFGKLAKDADPKDNAWDILKSQVEETPQVSQSSSGTSKRAEKRKAKQALWKARREKAKARRNAKKDKEKATSAAEVTSGNATPELSKAAESPSSSKSKPSKVKAKSKPQVGEEDVVPAGAKSSPKKEVTKSSEKREKKRKLETSISQSTSEASIINEKPAKKPKLDSKKEKSAIVPGPTEKGKKGEEISVKTMVKSIAKSASDRAKRARSKALSRNGTKELDKKR